MASCKIFLRNFLMIRQRTIDGYPFDIWHLPEVKAISLHTTNLSRARNTSYIGCRRGFDFRPNQLSANRNDWSKCRMKSVIWGFCSGVRWVASGSNSVSSQKNDHPTRWWSATIGILYSTSYVCIAASFMICRWLIFERYRVIQFVLKSLILFSDRMLTYFGRCDWNHACVQCKFALHAITLAVWHYDQ